MNNHLIISKEEETELERERIEEPRDEKIFRFTSVFVQTIAK